MKPGKPSNSIGHLLDAARDYLQRGWTLIPTKGKHAAFTWKQYQSAPPPTSWLSSALSSPGIDGIAVVLGQASGNLGCRDWDTENGYSKWAEAHPDLAAVLPTVQTPRGRHVYHRFQGQEQYWTLDDGEYRADSGHYCLLPPSRHPSGSLYRWLIPLYGELPAIDPSQSGLLLSHPTGDPPATHRNPLHCVSLPGLSQIIADTLPSGPGQRNRCVFDFARMVKGIMPMASPAELRQIVGEWHRLALPVIRTRDFGTTWQDFQIAWQRIQKPYRPATLFAAFATAISRPDPPIENRQELGILAGACRELQAIAGDSPFYLSARSAAKHLSISLRETISHMTAWRWLRSLEFFGVIRESTKGHLKGLQASEFRYLGAQKAQASIDSDGPYRERF
ncbi:MAG TPA: bifunctional DNA primase/polymerase [Gemmataceae bacterium]|nr:bifunctional DNA primase/polymerase [Gemmataceae bacterium]